MARNDANQDFPIFSWEVALTDESTLINGRVATVVHKEAPVVFENFPIESPRTENKGMIARKVKFSVM